MLWGRIDVVFSRIVVENVWHHFFMIFVVIKSPLDGSDFRLILEEGMKCSIDNETLFWFLAYDYPMHVTLCEFAR
jgi:hypothetical protein